MASRGPGDAAVWSGRGAILGWNGPGGDYTDEELSTWKRRIAQWRRERDVYVYFNNDWALALSRENFDRYVAFARAFTRGTGSA